MTLQEPAPLLQVSGLSVAYDGRAVLHAVDLDVPAGQLLCLLGPSGGGKSTLLRATAGLEDPSAGWVRLADRDLTGVPAHQRGIGLMFQDYALFPHRDVGDNVVFGLRMQGVDDQAARARVRELLELVGLAGAERRSVSQLSGGEQQRVALARALAPRPRLLMLDEPMGSLDRALRERLPEELRSIFAALGLTTIYVTHDQDEALSIADRVVVLHEGRIVADGMPEDLWRHPTSAWLARFLGYRNVAMARLAGGDVVTPWGRLPGESVQPGLTVDALHAERTAAGLDLSGASGSGGVGTGLERRGASGTGGAGADLAIVLSAAGIVAAPDGPIRGRVASRRFRGDYVLVGVEVPGAPLLEVEVRGGELPAVGESVALEVRPGGAHLIDPSAGPTGAGTPEEPRSPFDRGALRSGA